MEQIKSKYDNKTLILEIVKRQDTLRKVMDDIVNE
jgi:hypothetical protein